MPPESAGAPEFDWLAALTEDQRQAVIELYAWLEAGRPPGPRTVEQSPLADFIRLTTQDERTALMNARYPWSRPPSCKTRNDHVPSLR